MQQTADVEILWITVDVAAECLPAYGSFFSSAAVADGDAMATDVDVEMTAACGSSFFSAAVVVSATDAAMAVDADARQHNISCIGLKRRSHFSVSFFRVNFLKNFVRIFFSFFFRKHSSSTS